MFELEDLNYRIELPDEDLRALVKDTAEGDRDFSEILPFDQVS